MIQALKTYRGETPFGRRDVSVHLPTGRFYPLNPRSDLVNHSPDGFNWGYGGSGPAQLSLALLADAYGDKDVALRLYQQFKWVVVARLPQERGWRLSQEEIFRAVDKIEKRQARERA
jgi:hypothetical protein